MNRDFMKPQLQALRRGWLFAGAWGLAAAVVVGLGLLYLTHQRTLFRQSVENQLSAIAITKVQLLLDWRRERFADATTLMADPFLARGVQQFLANPSNSELQAQLVTRLQAACAESQGLRASLLDSHLKVQAVFPEDETNFGPIATTSAEQAMLSNQVVVSAFRRSQFSNEIHFDVAIPVQLPAELPGSTSLARASSNGQTIAVINLEVDPSKLLYPLIRDWPTPSLTAETLLVRREGDEVAFVSDLRHRQQAALTFRSPLAQTNTPAAMALLGREGSVEGVDYRGKPVMAAVRAVPGTTWKLVSKIDQQEVLAPLRTLNRLTLAVMLSLVLGTGLGSWALWRQVEARRLARELSERTRMEQALACERDLLTTLLDNTPDAIYFKDLESRFVRYSNSFKALFNTADIETIKGKTDFDFFTDEHARPAYEDEQQIIRTGKPILDKQEKETHPDGRVTWALTSKIPWRDKAGQIIGTFGISKDITLRKEAEAELQALQRQLLETSRQAGMAEVASNVLHNVGNVLNSVNISVDVIVQQVRASKASGVSRAATLLEAHRDNLAAFLSGENQAEKLLAYLKTLAGQLASEQTTALTELKGLSRNIEHIKEIVAMQQNYAGVSGVIGLEHIPALVEDALRMHDGSLTRHKVRVIRQFDNVPNIQVDKHKVLQILVNLISNAKYALSASADEDRPLTIRVGMNGDDRVRVSVADQGIGIAPENLTRIFTHGFTTKKNGHGFGLHSAALAAQDLGGSLRVHSDGLGKGATFTLELPAPPPERHAQERQRPHDEAPL